MWSSRAVSCWARIAFIWCIVKKKKKKFDDMVPMMLLRGEHASTRINYSQDVKQNRMAVQYIIYSLQTYSHCVPCAPKHIVYYL